MLRISVEVNVGIITAAQPLLGSMHRGAEKLFESRDYRQVLGLANRHEWLSAYSGEVGVAQLVEQAVGIDVPPPAKLLRTVMLEVSRVTSHLAFLAAFPWSDESIGNTYRTQREQLVAHIQQYTGSRMHHMLTRIGGLTHAPTREWVDGLLDILELMTQAVTSISPSSRSEFAGQGILTLDAAQKAAVSGPVARASSYAIDLRTQDALLASNSAWSMTQTSSGDVTGRLEVLHNEVVISANCIRAFAQDVYSVLNNEVNVLLPKVLRVPEGSNQHSIETPLGIASWFLVSKGDKMPYRLKLRPASLHTVLALPNVLINQPIEHLAPIIASMPFVAGDIDR
jgi:NADH-quinone oxidoreductase subunit D